MPDDVVRYGIISTAQIALNRHIPAARTSANSEITAISSRSDAPARQAADEHGIPNWYGSYDELLADPDLDAVVNPLPNSMHAEWTIKAAEAGKHILCERPLSVDVAEGRRMIDASNANNGILVEAFTHRWSPHLRKARQLIADGAIGEVTGLDSAVRFNVEEPEGNVRFSKELAGGSLMNASCYAVYAVRFAMSTEPVRAIGFARDNGNWGVDTTFSGLLEFPNGAVAHVSSSMEQERRCFLEVSGTDGRIDIPNMFDDSGPIVITRREETETESTPAPNRFQVQFDEFSECVLTGKAPEYPPEDGLRNMAAIVALLASARDGATVPVEQI